jgi:hypothetical protein
MCIARGDLLAPFFPGRLLQRLPLALFDPVQRPQPSLNVGGL